MTLTIDHLGIAVKSLSTAKSIYQTLGLTPSADEVVEGEQVRVAMLPVGESRLELLEATSESSAIAKFIADWGFQIDPLSCVMILVVTGVGFLIHIYSTGYMAHEGGAGGHRYVFVHPSSAGGVLLELVEAAH